MVLARITEADVLVTSQSTLAGRSPWNTSKMRNEKQPSEPVSDEALLEQIAGELVDLRFEHERRIGVILAKLNYRARQRERERRAEAARADRGGAR